MADTINFPRDTSIQDLISVTKQVSQSQAATAAAIEAQNGLLKAHFTAGGETMPVTSWKQVQDIVRGKAAKLYFKAGDQLVCTKGTGTLVWDIADVQESEITLVAYGVLPELQFDNFEAFYSATAILPAGTYNVTIPTTWSKATAGTYQFTLTKDLPIGGQLSGLETCADTDPSNWKVKAWASSSATTATETVAVSSGSSGTSLGSLIPAGDGVLNSIHRVGYGNNNWRDSALRQWCNSSAVAGSVWKPQHKFDRPPTWALTTAGFMNDLDPEFLAVISTTDVTTVLNTVTDGGGSVVTKDKFFLLSRTEINGSNETSIAEGSPLQYFTDLRKDTGTGRNDGVDDNRIKYYISNGAATYWWLRTPYSGDGYIVRDVYPTGTVSDNGACFGNGVVPACKIS